jgi:hypothetical protein
MNFKRPGCKTFHNLTPNNFFQKSPENSTEEILGIFDYIIGF